MDASDNTSVSSTPHKRLSFSKGTDENDQSYQERGLNVQNTKKSITSAATKHFMSPTIAATSKANPPRKKILAERNESLDTHPQKTPTFGSKTTSSIEFVEYGENGLLDDLSSRPYDPLTNYLSPRPKFLRYKPNRQKDIFLRRENEAKEGNDETSSRRSCPLESKNDKDIEGDSLTSLADGTQEENVKKEGEGVDENEEEFEEVEEEFEEVEEERCWGFRGVLKLLLLLVVLVLSTSYISTMNSPTPSPVVQAVGRLKNGYHMIQDHVHGIVKNLELESRNYILVQNGPGIDEEETMDYEVMGEYEYDDELDEAVEKQNGESEVLEIVEDEQKGTVEGFGEVGETEVTEIVEHEDKSEIAKMGSVVEPQAAESAPEMVKAGEVSDECLKNEVAMNPELHSTEAIIMSESPFINDWVDSLAMPSSVPENFEKENEVVNEPVKQEVVDGEIGNIWNTTDDHAEHYEIPSDDAEERLKEGIKKDKDVVVFSTLFSIISGLALAFHFKRKRNAQKDPSPVVQPSFGPVAEEKCISMCASEADKNTEHVVPFTNSANSMEENCEVTYQSRVPSVAFLGEFEVGEMSSPLRSCGTKSRMIESDVSIHSVSMEKGIATKAHSVSVHVQPAFSEISTMDSPCPSSGRFTNEKKNVKKQKEADGETKMVVTTPVRRSSRIRKRSIISP